MDKLLLRRDLAPYFPEGRVPHNSTLNRWERLGRFPAADRISARYKTWRQSKIEAWVASDKTGAAE